MIALVPHIVRSPEYTENNLRPVATGNDQTVKLSYAHEAPAAEGKTAAPATGQTPAATPEAPAPPAPEAPKPTAPPAAAQPRMAFNVPAQEARLGSAVTLTLSVENATDLFSAPLRLKFDPKVLRLSEVAKGGFLSGDGQNIIFTRNIQNDVGEVTVNLNRLPGSGGISGGGALVTLVFQAAGPGASKVFVSEAPLRNSQLQPIVLPAPETTITVK